MDLVRVRVYILILNFKFGCSLQSLVMIGLNSINKHIFLSGGLYVHYIT